MHGQEKQTQGTGSRARRGTSVEGVSAGTGAGRVRVVDGETLLLDRVDEVDRGTCQVRPAHLVGHHLNAAEGADDVAVDFALVKVQLVAQARTATGLDRYPQPEIITVLLGQQGADLHGGNL